jgi:hypothetical protein
LPEKSSAAIGVPVRRYHVANANASTRSAKVITTNLFAYSQSLQALAGGNFVRAALPVTPPISLIEFFPRESWNLDLMA